MRTHRKEESQSSWRFTMEHIGRELRKLYPPADTPPGLHALFTRERRRSQERRRAKAMHRNRQKSRRELKTTPIQNKKPRGLTRSFSERLSTGRGKPFPQTANFGLGGRRATDAHVLEDAEYLITVWNERQAKRIPMLFLPTIGAAIAAALLVTPSISSQASCSSTDQGGGRRRAGN